jgi:beta-fructofuranosidase
MNDVNGCFQYQGYYHVFYQTHPFGSGFGEMYWGHTRSKDLVHWEQLPLAVWPSKVKDDMSCWSGGSAFDGRGEPMLFYTSAGGRPFTQWVAIPASKDLIVWKKHPANPILVQRAQGDPEFDPAWRDPFLCQEDGRTLMVIGGTGKGLPIYEAEDRDLTKWKYRGIIFDKVAECPNFFKLGEHWVFLSSAFREGVEYYIGSLDMKNWKFEPMTHGVMDFNRGPHSIYGTNIFFDDQGRCIFLGRLGGTRPGRNWNGCMMLPRVLTIAPDKRPVQRPAAELASLRSKHRHFSDLTLADTQRVLPDVSGDTLEIIAELALGDAKAVGLRLRRSADGTRAATIRYDGAQLDVAGVKFPVDPPKEDKRIKLHVFLDKSVIEVFVNDGRAVASQFVYTDPGDVGVAVFAEGGTGKVRLLDAWQMKPIW